MKRNILLSIVCVLSILLLTGCTKTKVDVNRFKEVLNAYNFELSDLITENVSPEVKEEYVATKGDDYIIEYFLYDNVDFAKKAFEAKKTNYKNMPGTKNVLESNGTNYYKYRIITKGRLYLISRVDDTLLIVLTADTNKKEVEKIVNDLGY